MEVNYVNFYPRLQAVIIMYRVSQIKVAPMRFSDIFPKTVGNFSTKF